MSKNQWKLGTLVISGLSSIASLGLFVLPGNAATSTSDNNTKLSKFDLSEMSVEDISKINNSHLKSLLETARKQKGNYLTLLYDKHSSSHSNYSDG